MIYLIPLVVLAWLYVVWILYLSVQCLSLNRAKLSPWVFGLGMATFYFSLWLDIAFNWVVLTLLFYEFPRETTVSARLSRHHQHGSGWRQRFSGWVGQCLLDPFDPTGKHI